MKKYVMIFSVAFPVLCSSSSIFCLSGLSWLDLTRNGPKYAGKWFQVLRRDNWKMTARAVLECALGDAGFQAIEAAYRSQGRNLSEASHTEIALARGGSSIAASLLAEGVARVAVSSCADATIVRDTAENSAAGVLWAGIKDVSDKTGLTGRFVSIGAKAACVLRLDALPEGVKTFCKDAAWVAFEVLGQSFAKGTIVRPFSNEAFRAPVRTGKRFGIGLKRSDDGGVSFAFDGSGASVSFEL